MADGHGLTPGAAVAVPQHHSWRAVRADAYPALDEKAAALLHSLARNHALVDGSKRLALSGLIAFCGVNGRRLILTNDAAYEFVMAVASGELDTVAEIAGMLSGATGAAASR